MRYVNIKPLSIALTLLASALLAACGSGLVRGQAPFVAIRGIDTTGEALALQLRVKNLNGVAIELTNVRFSIELEGTPLGAYDEPSRSSIIANGSETLRLELDASEDGLDLLQALQQGDSPNLEYTIDGSLATVNEGTLGFTGKGRVYPVPGRPGRFR